MGLLAPILSQSDGYGPLDDYWYEPRYRTAVGLADVDGDAAMTQSGFYAGVAYLSEDIAKLPLHMYEDRGREGKREAPEHYLEPKLNDLPNRYQTALEFREMMQAFTFLHGRAVAEIRPGRRPLVDDEYVPLHPELVRSENLTNGERVYWYRDPARNMEERKLRDDQVFVLRGRLGRSVLDFAREALGVSLAQERQVGQLFSRGAKFPGVIKREWNRPWTSTERRNFRKALDEYAVNGQYSGRPLLLEDGMTWQDVGMKAADAELLDSRRLSVIIFCRYFRIPPNKIFELERATNNNIERLSIDYVVDSLLGHVRRWEQTIWRDLIILRDRGRYYAEHMLDWLMRGEFEARAKAYALAIQWGWMTRNEVRAKENMNRIEGADFLERPLNMEPISLADANVVQLEAGELVAVKRQLRLLASGASARLVRREMAGVEKLLERNADAAAIDAFYSEHTEQIARQLHVSEQDAWRYAKAHRDALLEHGAAAMSGWQLDGADSLTDLAMNQRELKELEQPKEVLAA